MEYKYDYIASTKYLSDLSKDGTPFRGRIALLSYQSEVSAKQLDKVIMFLEYGQLLLLLLLVNYKFYGQHEVNSINLWNLVSFWKVLGPGNLISAAQLDHGDVYTILGVCFALFIFRISLFVYVILLALKRKKGRNSLLGFGDGFFVFRQQF